MRASAWGSRAKRASTSRELSPARTILSATRRRTGPVSAASYTVPIPPSPSTPRIRYGPIISGAGVGGGSLVASLVLSIVIPLTFAFAAITDAAWSCDLLRLPYDHLWIEHQADGIRLPWVTRHVDGIGESLFRQRQSGNALRRRFVRSTGRTAMGFVL